MWVEVSSVDHSALSEKQKSGENSAQIRERVEKARQIQTNRFKKFSLKFKLNSELSAREINNIIELEKEAKEMLIKASRMLDLSARSYHKIMKIARTIADLESSENVLSSHLSEALQFRPRMKFE